MKKYLKECFLQTSFQIHIQKKLVTMKIDEILNSNIFNVMLNRRSQRKFENKKVEDWKVEIILAAADTAPTAGGFQGFEIFYILKEEIKEKLVIAANNQPYVNAPLMLVFCSNPNRIKMNFSPRHFTQIFIAGCNSGCRFRCRPRRPAGSRWSGCLSRRGSARSTAVS